METTFWMTNDGLIRILYLSPTCWENTLMADICKNTATVTLYNGKEQANRGIIAAFSSNPNPEGFRLMQTIGPDLTIIQETIDFIKKKQFKFGYAELLTHIEATLCFNYQYIQANSFTHEEIKRLIDQCFFKDFPDAENKKSLYCGITNDLDIRMQQHRENDFEIKGDKVYAWVCANATAANEVKQLASREYDTGSTNNSDNKNEEKKNSVLVYLLWKGKKI